MEIVCKTFVIHDRTRLQKLFFFRPGANWIGFGPESFAARLDSPSTSYPSCGHWTRNLPPRLGKKEKERRILITLPVYRYTNFGSVGSMNANRMPNGPNRTTSVLPVSPSIRNWSVRERRKVEFGATNHSSREVPGLSRASSCMEPSAAKTAIRRTE